LVFFKSFKKWKLKTSSPKSKSKLGVFQFFIFFPLPRIEENGHQLQLPENPPSTISKAIIFQQKQFIEKLPQPASRFWEINSLLYL